MRWNLQFGFALLASGMLWIIHALTMDTGVPLGDLAQAQGLAVDNLVQLAERHEFMVTGGVFAVIGVVLTWVGVYEQRKLDGDDVWKCQVCGEWIAHQTTQCPMCGTASHRAPPQHLREDGFTKVLSVLALLLATGGSNALGGVIIVMMHETQSVQFSRIVAELKTQDAVNRINALLGRGRPVSDCIDVVQLVDHLPFGYTVRQQPIAPYQDALCRITDLNGQSANLLVYGVPRRG